MINRVENLFYIIILYCSKYLLISFKKQLKIIINQKIILKKMMNNN